MAKLRLLRERAFHRQHGRCIYCRCRMWLKTSNELSPLKRRRDWLFQATAEHLRARCDGGKDASTNIAAACLYCNSHRHRRKKPLDPWAYQAYVLRRLANRRWHGAPFG